MPDNLSNLSKEFREALLRRNLSIGELKNSNVGLTRELGEYSPNSDNPDSAFSISNTKGVQSLLSYNRYTLDDEIAQHSPVVDIVRYNGSETYLDKYDLGSEETGKIKTLNMIGSVLNGTGVGWNGSGFEDTFDIRTTLAGRVLSATGVINDTPLGINSGKHLVNAMVNRIMFNAQRETFGRIDIDPINAIKGGDIIRPDYSITIGYNTATKAMEVLEDLTGINLPFSQLSPDASISKRGYSQALIKNTGKGQIKELFFNLDQNKFAPDYEDKRIKNISLAGKLDYENIRADFRGLSSSNDDYDNIVANYFSLLGKTQEMFRNNRNFLPLHKEKSIIVDDSEVTNTVRLGATNYMSRGSGVLNASALRGVPDENGNIFGRVFTKDNQYSHIKNLQKRTGLAYKDSADDSVLDSNGFIRVSPNKNDIMEGKEGNIKNFMFSIENLAWHDSDAYNDLAPSERGPGDLVNGTKGRIMWFPPYDISFSEVTSVNWETTQFIGRGEPIYTYNNTERVGSLDFKVIMDYPSYMEDLKGLSSDDLFRSIASGVMDVDYSDFKNLAPNEVRHLEVGTVVKPSTIMDSGQVEPEDFELYFDEGAVDPSYGPDNYTTAFSTAYITTLAAKLKKECPACTVYVKGYSSYDEVNNEHFERAARVRNLLISNGIVDNFVWVSKEDMGPTGCNGVEYPSNSDCKRRARKVVVSFDYDPAMNETNIQNVPPTVVAPERDLAQSLKKRFINEALYFEKLSEENPLVYESISESIKHFHPAFHSVTPEGFNSRLTFLHQCTRQGPTKSDEKASNLAFGRPPVCILRLGDFYHTKIVIDSVNLTFEDHQWDLNPEGAGVQPMIAKVSLSFKFIGGSSLKGPINKLQNAISHNFFANNEIFDDRADRIIKRDGKWQYASDKNKVSTVGLEPIGIEEPIIKADVPVIDEPARAEPTGETIEKNIDEELFNNLVFTYYFLTYTPPVGETEQMSFTFTKKDSSIVIEKPFKVRITVDYRVTGEQFDLGAVEITEALVNDLANETIKSFTKRLDVPYLDEQWDTETQGPILLLTFTRNEMKRIIEFPTMNYGT